MKQFMNETQPRHPLGSEAKILLASVFGPYAREDSYGSRRINPMELYENQITRVQGAFSLRMFHRSFSLLMIQENLEADCTVLDFPDLDRFIQEVSEHSYDIVGISGIVCNVGKVRKMCELIRQHLPRAKIVIGGHVTAIPDLEEQISADHIVRGDGIRWFREYLGEDPEKPVRHPAVHSGFGTRILGLSPKENPADQAAILIPSVGCPMGCNFCATSHFFGGKGKGVAFYEKAEELFSVMCSLEEKLKIRSFFVLDENFLLFRERAERLLELMEEHGKSWSFYVFSSANIIRSYPVETLVRFGIRWIWMGLEGKNSAYSKLRGADTRSLVRTLQSHGISVLGSSIIGLDDHTPENMNSVIDWAVSHDSDFHQFMLYTALPGTPLYRERLEQGTLFPPDELPYADIHGQYCFNYRHPSIVPGKETGYLLKAFGRDFETNGPSLARMIRTMLAGWKKHKNHPDPRVCKRIRRENRDLATVYAAVMWAICVWYRKDRTLRSKMEKILAALKEEFGWKARVAAPVLGLFVLIKIASESKKLERGWTYEPPTFYEKKPRSTPFPKGAIKSELISDPSSEEEAEAEVSSGA